MTAPDPEGPARPTTEGDGGPTSFSMAEKLMAEWEARHDVAAAGRRPSSFNVGSYLAHTRCEDARTAPEHREHVAPRPQRRPGPPDAHPHVSDLLAWIVTPSSTRRDDEPPERRGKHEA
jgi:hypothetical protein